ncbi:tRNA dihydrouridine synthase DusB [bacterium]
MIRELIIGRLKLDTNLFLAPLANITLKPLRVRAKQFGAGLVCTEMISSYGLVYDNKKTKQMIDIGPDEKPAAVQLFGSDPEILGDAAKIAEHMGADLIDINMGCPAPKVVKNMHGSALMKDPDLVKKIIKAVAAGVRAPVTLKIRAGWDLENINAQEIAHIAENEGIQLITVHARTKTQRFADFNWDIVRKVKQTVKIPVIGNGNIFSPLDAKKMFETTGCDGIMIGRGALSKPWIFKQIIDFFTTGKYTEFTDSERINYIIDFTKDFVQYRNSKPGIYEVRKFIAWLTKGMNDSAKLRSLCFKTESLEDLIKILEQRRI